MTNPQFLQAKRSTRGVGPFDLLLAGNVCSISVGGLLTVADAMALLTAVEAHYDVGIGLFGLLLRAALGDMADLLAVAAPGKTAIDDLASILEALNVLLDVLGPDLAIARTRGVPLEPVGHSVLLTQVALEIHVGEGRSETLLNGDEPGWDFLFTEGALKLRISRLRRRLDINLNAFFQIVTVAIPGSGTDKGPGLFGSHVRNMAAIDLASVLTVADGVAWNFQTSQQALPLSRLRQSKCHTRFAAVSADAVWTILHDVIGGVALLASHGRSVGAVLAPMAFLIATAAGTAQHTGVRAIRLVMTMEPCQSRRNGRENESLTRSRRS